jgi:hypothetical protein
MIHGKEVDEDGHHEPGGGRTIPDSRNFVTFPLDTEHRVALYEDVQLESDSLIVDDRRTSVIRLEQRVVGRSSESYPNPHGQPASQPITAL